MKMKKWMLAAMMAVLLAVLSACASTGGNNVSRAYDEAMNLMIQGKYAEAAEKLSGITYYEDSAQLSLYCRAHAWAGDGNYDGAVSELQKLGGFRDSARCAAYFSVRQEEDTADTPYARALAADLYDGEELNGFRDAQARSSAIRAALYRDGVNAEQAENWEEAAGCFGALESYEDSGIRFGYAGWRTCEAAGGQDAASYARAAVYYHGAAEYLDAAEREKACLDSAFAAADGMIRAGNFDGAEGIYRTLGDLCGADRYDALKEAKDAAAEEARQARAAEADALLAEEKFDEARAAYLACGEQGMADEALYLKAAWLDVNGKAEDAAGVYLGISSYKDSREKHYQLGKSRTETDPETAARILLEDSGYPGAADDLYAIAVAASEAGNYPLSVVIYGKYAGTRDCTLQMKNDPYLYGRQLLEEDDPGKAAEIFDRLEGSAPPACT